MLSQGFLNGSSIGHGSQPFFRSTRCHEGRASAARRVSWFQSLADVKMESFLHARVDLRHGQSFPDAAFASIRQEYFHGVQKGPSAGHRR